MTMEAQEARIGLALGLRIHNIHCSDPLYVLGKRSKPIGCQINLILNSWRFPQYVLWARLADIFPMWPRCLGEIPACPLVYVLDDTLIIADRNR